MTEECVKEEVVPAEAETATPPTPPAATPATAATATADTATKHVVGGKEYKFLADGKYDVIICGTGTTECILSGLFAVKRLKVLHIDRNDFYGAKAASLNLTNLFVKFKGREPTKEEFDDLGSNRDYNIDLVPKFLMASGELVKLLIHTKVTRYLDFKVVGGSFVVKGQRNPKISKIPTTTAEAIATPLMGFFQKNKLRRFLGQVADDKISQYASGTAAEMFKAFGLDANSVSFIGHAMALQSSDDYLQKNAGETIEAIKLYAHSLSRHGSSPYLYPMYGLGGLAEGFARLCAVYGGTFMLHQPIDELVTDASGKVIGVRAKDEVATAAHIIGDPSYFPADKVIKGTKVVRSICFLDHPIAQTSNAESCQIIIPALQVKEAGYPARQHDIYISCVSFFHKIAPKGRYVAIVSTEVETDDPLKEVALGISLLGKIRERFDDIVDGFSENTKRAADNCFISSTYDGTSHFQSVAADVQRIYKSVTGEVIDMTIDATMEE